MSCEFENRCLNTDKCFRCYNLALLKLPEDKQKRKLNKKITRDFQKTSSDRSWAELEETVAMKLNQVPVIQEARRSRMSGALWFEQGDVVDTILHPECKERIGSTLKTGEKSMSIKKEWLEKAKDECKYTEKVMCLPFRFKHDENIYTIVDFDDLASLVTTIKAYMQDNDKKAEEIALLKKKENNLG